MCLCVSVCPSSCLGVCVCVCVFVCVSMSTQKFYSPIRNPLAILTLHGSWPVLQCSIDPQCTKAQYSVFRWFFCLSVYWSHSLCLSHSGTQQGPQGHRGQLLQYRLFDHSLELSALYWIKACSNHKLQNLCAQIIWTLNCSGVTSRRQHRMITYNVI